MPVSEPLETPVAPAAASIAREPAELAVDDPLRLFLGTEPSLLIRWPSSAGGLSGRTEIGSILVAIDAEAAGAGDDLHALLNECARVSSRDGRIAVLMPNCVRLAMARLSAWTRRRNPEGRTTDGTWASVSAWRPTLGQVERSLRASGFADIAIHSADQCEPWPGQVRPRRKFDTWTATAWLVTARREGSRATTRLASIVDEAARASTGAGAGDLRESLSWSRIRNSSRGKSLVIAQCGETGCVIHLPRWAVAQADTVEAHRILRDLQTNPAISRQVPRPLGQGTIDAQTWYAETRLPGVPLVAALAKGAARASRRGLLREAVAFLRALNPDLRGRPAVALTVGDAGVDIREMLDRVLAHLPDDGLRGASRSLFASWTDGAASRIGLVHGDFGASNILVSGNRISGVIDWEAARRHAPPVLDAFNYLDSVERCCNSQLTIVDTIPMLAEGEWPDEEGFDFLRRFFDYCGIDFCFRRAFALLYFLFHVGPQLRFAASERGPSRRAEEVLRRLARRP